MNRFRWLAEQALGIVWSSARAEQSARVGARGRIRGTGEPPEERGAGSGEPVSKSEGIEKFASVAAVLNDPMRTARGETERQNREEGR
jgi:hypothetical protein